MFVYEVTATGKFGTRKVQDSVVKLIPWSAYSAGHSVTLSK
jgi:hypothetical protein